MAIGSNSSGCGQTLGLLCDGLIWWAHKYIQCASIVLEVMKAHHLVDDDDIINHLPIELPTNKKENFLVFARLWNHNQAGTTQPEGNDNISIQDEFI